MPVLSHEGNPVVSIQVQIDTRKITAKGRDAWTLAQLIDAGKSGVTPIERPAPRWSHYVWKLRGLGVAIETIDEKHGGAFAGQHARYQLTVPLTVVSIERQHDKRRSAAGRAA